MDNQTPSKGIDSGNDLNKSNQYALQNSEESSLDNKVPNVVDNSQTPSDMKNEVPSTPKKPVKPPKLEDKPFKEFILNHFIPGLRSSIEGKGTDVADIQLIEGNRPVVGGNCWMVFCELSEERKFWLCFNKDIITSDKTILLAESNSDPSIVESFLIDEKKTTLPLLISRVLQRLNGQKWIGVN